MAAAWSGGIVGVLRTPTFYVETEQQRRILSTFHKNTEDIKEEVHKTKTLCFSAQAFQKQHPDKTRKGIRDADVTLGSPMILGIADGVSQVEEFGIDASLLPRELLMHCQDLGDAQLTPGYRSRPQDKYRGPIPLLTEAFQATDNTLGSTTATLALLDNSTKMRRAAAPDDRGDHRGRLPAAGAAAHAGTRKPLRERIPDRDATHRWSCADAVADRSHRRGYRPRLP
ncbi:unnamed protein product [Prorocentrum cordatum]|uniref:Protein phosphatase n=1 Tax=Prorocentrum cordatum TaxID=2364126 RepID=A0ABN9UUP9_9DINO|nr:unnamed protein product [Polarella glacialis]